MKSTLKSLTVVALRLACATILMAPFALAVLLLIHGEIGLGVVILGLGLLQAMVMVMLWSYRRRNSRAARNPLWPAA
ncbi:MAG: hypothetical protein NXH97_08345 [Rhodobacteraceae bacterium]|nr:hypothetical protein [Paracoccaceae bacterium]